MENERSTNQKVKDLFTKQGMESKVTMTEVYAQMVIDELHMKFRKKQLEDLINKSLDEKNREDFMKWTKEYNQLVKE